MEGEREGAKERDRERVCRSKAIKIGDGLFVNVLNYQNM